MTWAASKEEGFHHTSAYKVLVSKSEGEGPFVKIRNRWEDDIQTDLNDFLDWIHLAEDSDEQRVILNGTINLWNILTICVTNFLKEGVAEGGCTVFCMNQVTDTIKFIKVTEENVDVDVNVEAVPSFETPANVYQTIRRDLYSSSV
jgi:hypothetical protein